MPAWMPSAKRWARARLLSTGRNPARRLTPLAIGQRLLVVLEGRHHHEGAEDLLAGNPVVGLGPDDGWLDKAAVGQRRVVRRLAAGEDLAALVHGDIQ